MPKKSQFLFHSFIFIISLIVLSLIVVLGYSAINFLTEKSYQTDVLTFQNNLKNEVEKMLYRYGSINDLSLRVPSKITEICFVDKKVNLNIINNAIIKNAVESNTNENVFLIENSVTGFYIQGIELDVPFYYCIKPVSNRLVIRLESKGKTVLITPLISSSITNFDSINNDYEDFENDINDLNDDFSNLYSDLNSIEW